MSNNEKSRQLGMSFSTARSRLVKQLLFRELQGSGGNTCFKCEEKIDDIDTLSIEHKEPWLHVSPDLFWNLDNIAFSHLDCNRPHRYNGNGKHFTALVDRRKVDGVAWCSGHQSELPVNRFTKNKKRYNGLQDLCRECRSEYRKSRNRTQEAYGTTLET